jgi:4-hydroxy-tetrahydrodipicolinate synthase
MRRLFDLTREARLAEAMELQRRILELFDMMLYQFEFPDGFRAGVEMRGFHFGRSRQPQTTAQAVERARLKNLLQCLVADAGLVEPPPGGCLAPEHGPQQQDVAQIAAAVLDALREKGLV